MIWKIMRLYHLFTELCNYRAVLTCAGKPATLAYANDCGITVRPTVTPATRSPSPS